MSSHVGHQIGESGRSVAIVGNGRLVKGMLLVELQALIELYCAASVCVSLSHLCNITCIILWLLSIECSCKRNNLANLFS